MHICLYFVDRQWHKAFFRKSDLFFVCMMRPLSFDIQIQESEIEAAKVKNLKRVESETYPKGEWVKLRLLRNENIVSENHK